MDIYVIMISFFLLLVVAVVATSAEQYIEGTYSVRKGFHYANKTSLSWGENNFSAINVSVSMSSSCATYNCSSSCSDNVWYLDWNKLWGKVRCGYMHSNHDDSDRFVWRRCSDPTCDQYISGKNMIQLAAYSYDNGKKPYETEYLLKPFLTLVEPEVWHGLGITMDSYGLSTFSLFDSEGKLMEVQTVQHENLCADKYYEGMLQGLYFGGSCTAPVDVVVEYSN